MGNAQVTRVDEPRVLLTEYTIMAYQDVLASYKMFKVLQCVHELEGTVVVKLFLHREGAPNLSEVKQKIEQVKTAFRSSWLHPHVVPYQAMEITSRSAILMRQHFVRNLYDRMFTRPFLTELTKKWIAFQVLCGVCQAHAAGVAHGDLKTENIFVSSWNHAVLSDFAHFKPLMLPEDDPTEFSFFFESNLTRRRCYLAPERFDASAGRIVSYAMHERFSEELAAMDVFSLGCTLAELFLDGQTLMDLPALLNFRSRQVDLQAKIAGIKDVTIRELIGSMLQREPSKRLSATGYLREWCARAVPRSFCSCLFPLSVLLLHPVYQQPDMRIALIRHNFAGILWSVVGQVKIARRLRSMTGDMAKPVDARASLWEAWFHHIELHVRRIDEATQHSTVHTATMAASHWAGTPCSDPDVCPSERSKAHCSTSEGDPDREAEEIDQAGVGGQRILTTLAHPWLQDCNCETFSAALINLWDEGRQRCIATGQIDSGEGQAYGAYRTFVSECCAAHGVSPGDGTRDQTPKDLPDEGALAFKADDDVLSIVVAFICSSMQHLSNPRMKIVCLDMFEQMSSFVSQSTILEEIVPYAHALMTDPVAGVRARSIDLLIRALERIEELPFCDTPLFMEYLFPQLMSAMSNMTGEPVVLLAIARNIGALAQHAVRFAELSVAAAQQVSEEQVSKSGSAERADRSAEASSKAEIESFDVQWKHLREEVKRIVKTILEYLPIGPQAEKLSMDCDCATYGGPYEEVLMNLAMGREIKIALLRNMCVLADVFGRDETHNFLLPYLISFMNDPAWEVRATFCEEAARLPKKVGQVPGASAQEVFAEGMIWPCYEQALVDQEERVLEAALRGLVTLASQRVLRRQSLVTVATKVAPLLVHPSSAIQLRAAQVIDALGSQLTTVDEYVFLIPTVRPFLRVEALSLRFLSQKLARPLDRQLFRRAVLHRDEELYEALVHRKPLPFQTLSAFIEMELPSRSQPQDAPGSEVDVSVLELIRPYLQLLLRTRPSTTQIAAGLPPGVSQEEAWGTSSPLILQTLQYTIVNPACPASRSLLARAEAEDLCRLPLHPENSPKHPLSFFSMHTFLIQALCLPQRLRELGSLSNFNGTPYSIYAAGAQKSDAIEDADTSSGVRADMDSSETDAIAGSMVTGLPGLAALTSSDRRFQGAVDLELEQQRIRPDGSSHRVSWKPRGLLLATLYEYAHQSGVPVVKVDTTDDSRILITGGRDGVVKIWNCAALERDVAVSSSHTFQIPVFSTRRKQQLRALRTVRNAKSVVIGSESGDVLLYRIEPSRGGPCASQVCRFASGEKQAGNAVMCIEQFDTDLDSLLVFAQQHGNIHGWDIRSHAPSWSMCKVPPWLGVPSCLSVGTDGHTVIVGTLAGGLLVYDLRFLASWKQWRISSGVPVLSLRCANLGVTGGVFAALGSESNEVAFFDVVRGACVTLLMTEPVMCRQADAAVSVPSLVAANSGRDAIGLASACITPELLQANLPSSRRPEGHVTSLWLAHARSSQASLLASGADRKVRYWSLDMDRHLAEACVVTPYDSLSQLDKTRERFTYSSNHLGDVFVVQEQSMTRQDLSSRSGPASPSEVEDTKARGTNPNHRDAILDMCTISLQHDILVTAGRDGLVKLWR